ncbi:DegV family protein [Eubacteriales bacterium OttesenSCG-928-M02]|nr:DegV family protein [Eubacteriales bacterium OttesenSCG-928-M02]
MVKLIVDSVADLDASLAEKEEIGIVPLTVSLKGVDYDDRTGIGLLDIYKAMTEEGEFPKTAAPSPKRFYDAFVKELDAGNSVICITVSSGLSGTYQNACLAANELSQKGRVDVIDSKAAGITIGIVAILAARAAREGLDHDTVLAMAQERTKKMHTYVMLDTLDFLVMGGRISGLVAKAASLLNIKPIIAFNDAGELYVRHKPMGFKKGLKWLYQTTVEKGVDFTNTILGYAYGDTPLLVDQLHGMLEKSIKIKETITTQIGCVIGAYTGVSGVGIFFEEA